MARSSKQRYRTNCQYFNFACLPRGKYSLECGRPYYRKCPDLLCPAGLPIPGNRKSRGYQTSSEVGE